ncbi:MAG: phage replisome organizer N-terminal domain-containing protein [Oscillospiraceae bacterium]|nr:phage replisome organizer N-terminal domain-containing protein [Oscillospiraceae bacterium]
MPDKRYYWLKLKEDFFDEKYIKALRKLPQGDSQVIVYLKMQLKSLKTEGIINYEGILPDCISELALALDEDENVVRLTVEALIRFGVVERLENDTLYMLAMQQLIGSETQTAARVRKHRENIALQCNATVTKCNTEKEIREKRVEKEKDTPPTPSKGAGEGFDEFWKAYPKKVAKAQAQKAWNKIKPDKALLTVIIGALERQKQSAQWLRDDGQYIPYPATWLNGRRWEDMQEQVSQPAPKKYEYDPDNPYANWD